MEASVKEEEEASRRHEAEELQKSNLAMEKSRKEEEQIRSAELLTAFLKFYFLWQFH